jgi:hypothetical protein
MSERPTVPLELARPWGKVLFAERRRRRGVSIACAARMTRRAVRRCSLPAASR